jgi:tetratricopeptide (TPR) repeat protein
MTSLALIVLMAAAAPLAGGSPTDSLRARHAPAAADSTVAALRALEARSGRRAQSGDAAFTLGQLHYARGEFRPAAEAFARAAARFDPEQKPEARYWAGLAWLGIPDVHQARAAFEEVIESNHSRRAGARLGLASVWELQQRPERGVEELTTLLAADPGEIAPAALERMASLYDRIGRPEEAVKTRERLFRQFPNSLEAAGAKREALPQPAETGSAAVLIGAFRDPARARALADAARRAGFATAQVTARFEAGARSHAVRLGPFASPEEARRAGRRAADSLGVSFQIVGAP